MIYLSDRKILEVSGSDRLEFLQGLITQDIFKLREEKILFSAFLSPQGKFLADFFLYENGDSILIDIHESFVESFLKKLKIYKLRSDVEITELDYFVYLNDAKLSDIYGKDSRSEILGYRNIVKEKISGADDLNEYQKLRYDNLIIDGAYDLEIDRSFILEFGYEKLGAVDFEKGCYVGQEVITRTYRRGVIRKKPYSFETEDKNVKLEKGDEVFCDGKKIGKVCSFYDVKNLIQGILLCRIEEVNEDIEVNGQLLVLRK
jgi:folate-binding protein YgfZ